MPREVIRIFSDIHFGDRSSRVTRLAALAPLGEGADRWVVNGDTLDTRPGPAPEFTRERREEVADFLRQQGRPVTLLTGNHDPDISDIHFLELAQSRVFLTHGDVLFPDIVPWGRDAPLIRRRFAEETRRLPQGAPQDLPGRLALLRRVAAGVRQRHQSERRPGRYWAKLAADILWPPWRFPRTLEAWWSVPRRARDFAARHGVPAQVLFVGHTHRPALWRSPGGPTIVNTGSFCRPFEGWAADLDGDRLSLRPILRQNGEFRAGDPLAELRLAPPGR